MRNFRIGPYGYGLSNYILTSGLPLNEMTWTSSFSAHSASANSLANTEGVCFINTRNDDTGSIFLSVIHLDTCNVERVTELQRASRRWASDLRVNHSGVLVEKYYIPLSNGKGKHIDLGALVESLNYEPNGVNFCLGESLIAYNLMTDGPDFEYFLFDILTKEYQVLKLPIKSLYMVPNSDLMFGDIPDDEGNVAFLGCFDRFGNCLWKVAKNTPYFIVIGLYVFYYHNGDLLASDIQTGEVRYRLTAHEKLEVKIVGRYIFSDDTYAFVEESVLHVFSWAEDRLLYKLEDQNIFFVTGAGDVIFAIRARCGQGLGPYSDTKFQLITAYDRYTGETLWEIDKYYGEWHTLYVLGDFLVAESSLGKMACWELGEPYISPHRPK